MTNNQGRGVVVIESWGGGINFLPLKRGGLLEEGACLRGWGGFTVIKKVRKYQLYELVKTMMRMSSFFIFHNYYLF